MFYRILFLFLLSATTTHGQSAEIVSKELFHTDEDLQKTIQLMDNAFDFKKEGPFWELTALSNNWKEAKKNTISVDPKGETAHFEIKLELDYAINYKRHDIETIDIKGSKIPLFGKHGAMEQLKAIDDHPNLLYQANENGFISKILIKELKAIAELTYDNGNLVRFHLTTKNYWGKPQIFKRDFAKAQIAKACAKTFTPLSLEQRIDLTRYEPTCIAYCDPAQKKKPHYMFGNLVFNGPIKNGLPEGKGWWAIDTPCSGYFDKKRSGSYQYGNFTNGVATGWHTVDRDSVELEYFYEDGIITAVKGDPIILPFDGIGYLNANVVNGIYQDNEAVIRTGEDHETYVKMVDGEVIARDNTIKYYDKNGSFVTLHLDETGKNILKVVRRSPDEKMILTEYINPDGEMQAARKLEVKNFDLRHTELMPQSIIAVGDVKVDLVNGKWGGENLKITFPNKKELTLTGSFMPAHFFSISTAPTGEHILRGSKTNFKATYKEGRYVSGDEIYKLKESYSNAPMTINFNRETNPTAFYSYENEITIPLPPKAYGIAFERPVINDMGCTFEYMFNRTDGKQVHWLEKSLDGGEVISYDRHDNIGLSKRKSFNYQEVKVRRKDCKGEFIRVYLFE